MVKEMNGERDEWECANSAKCMGMTTIVNIRAAGAIEVRTIEVRTKTMT